MSLIITLNITAHHQLGPSPSILSLTLPASSITALDHNRYRLYHRHKNQRGQRVNTENEEPCQHNLSQSCKNQTAHAELLGISPTKCPCARLRCKLGRRGMRLPCLLALAPGTQSETKRFGGHRCRPIRSSEPCKIMHLATSSSTSSETMRSQS